MAMDAMTHGHSCKAARIPTQHGTDRNTAPHLIRLGGERGQLEHLKLEIQIQQQRAERDAERVERHRHPHEQLKIEQVVHHRADAEGALLERAHAGGMNEETLQQSDATAKEETRISLGNELHVSKSSALMKYHNQSRTMSFAQSTWR